MAAPKNPAVGGSEYVRDIAIRYQVYLERLKAGIVQDFDPVLVKLDRKLRGVLAQYGTGNINKLSKKDFNKLLGEVNQAVADSTGKYVVSLVTDLKAIASYAAEFEAKSLGEVAPIPVSKVTAKAVWQRATTAPIEATGDTLPEFLANWQARTAKQVENTIKVGYQQGKTIGQIVTDLRGRKANNYKDGVLTGKTRRETQAVVRTAVQHASAQAREAVWEENSDIVDGYTWVSTLDSRTTQICRSLDGMSFEIGNGPTPPVHIGCRSVTVANIKGVNVLAFAKRASKGANGGKQVAANMTYYEWLKTQPASFQDAAIGVERGKLLRKGGLSAEQFAALNLDKNFHPLTLEEMRKLEPAAFERAGI
jgi:SPP1 gp7 family putative phage head morphogenesis protein